MKKKTYLCGLLGLSLALLYFLLWENVFDESWNNASRLALFIFMLTAFLWITELIPLHITSFVVLFTELVFLLPMMQSEGLEISKKAFFAPFFSDIILLFMGGFVLSDLLNRYGISRRITSVALGKRTWRPSIFVLVLMLLTVFFSMWISNTATTAIVRLI